MAYSRPPYEPRPSPYDPERSRGSWDNMQRPHYPSMPSPSHHYMASPSQNQTQGQGLNQSQPQNILELESESSDVSDTPGDDYQSRIHSTYPTSIPRPPAKHLLESLDAIEARLRDLNRIEDENIKKQERLKQKRFRKDEKIRRKREAQDHKIKAIMDARTRRDDRISQRRKMEDEAFLRFDEDLEEEETGLRRRQKRLKRGLPVDDMSSGARISSVSMSPPGAGYTNAPPPAKRHQTGPPGQNDSPVISTPRPISHGAPSAPNSAGPNPPPPYAFLQSSHPPPSAPYGRSPTVSSQSPRSSSGGFPPIPRSHQPSSEPPPPPPFAMNGHPPSPHAPRQPIPTSGPILNTVPPPRQPSSSYDTRPPPVASGFATINAPPPASGFAPINPRGTATPPAPQNVPLAKGADYERVNGHVRPYAAEGTPTTSTPLTTSSSSKRTPSTTHPYQQSEAFANRHHHCERVDHLNRGVWTSFGPAGTKEVPTGPPQEMYLRCNHDGCRRIDWRTVHGLQCHIVKNHEQPKGTIGSLEKALDRYGVPVTEVEAYERQHGDGSGGTMADPKNLKLKTKSRESTEKADGQRRHGLPPNGSYQSKMAMSLGPGPQPYQGSPIPNRNLVHEDPEDTRSDSRTPPAHLATKISQAPRSSGFATVNGAYSIVPTPPTMPTAPATPATPATPTVPTPKAAEPREVEMKDVPRSPYQPDHGSVPKRDSNYWQSWPRSLEPIRSPPGNSAAMSHPAMTHSYPTHQPTIAHHPNEGTRPVAPAESVPVAAAFNSTPSHMHTSPKHEKFPVFEQSKPTQSYIADVERSPMNEKLAPANIEAPQQNHTMGLSTQEPESKPAPTDTLGLEKQVVDGREVQKESDASKADTIEPSKAEPSRSPEARRISVIGVRSSGRRSSVAASKVEKERQEREEAAAAQAEADKEKERKVKEEVPKQVEIEQEERQPERDEEQEKEEDSDDPDTITAAVTSSVTKDKDRDRDRENRENRTTPRRTANGRFTRKGGRA